MKTREERLAGAFKTLGDENRLRIVELLAEGEKTGSELLRELSVLQPTLSHHMKLLCDASLVITRKSGKWVYYSLAKDEMEQLALLLAGYGRAAEDKPSAPETVRQVKSRPQKPSPAPEKTEEKESDKPAKDTSDSMPAWLF